MRKLRYEWKHHITGTKRDVLSAFRLKVRTGRLGSNSSLSVSSRPEIQDSWDLLKSTSLVSSAGARSVCVFICICKVKTAHGFVYLVNSENMY